MDQISQVVLSLLRSALWGEKISCPADTDWEAVTKELRMQAVLGVLPGPTCRKASRRRCVPDGKAWQCIRVCIFIIFCTIRTSF